MSQLETNLSFLEQVDSGLVERLRLVAPSVSVSKIILPLDSGDYPDFSVQINEQEIYPSLYLGTRGYIEHQLASPDRVLMTQCLASLPPISSENLACQILDSDELITMTQMSALQGLSPFETDSLAPRKYFDHKIPPDVVVLGSLALVHADSLLSLPHLTSLLLVETSLESFVALLHVINFQSLVNTIKARNIKFDFLVIDGVSEDASRKHLLLRKVASSNPVSLNSFGIIKAFQLNPELIEIDSWLRAPDGFLYAVKGFLGNDTDEINQTAHALYSALRQRQADSSNQKLLVQSNHYCNQCVILVASGPSLDQSLQDLADIQDQVVIVSAGSSLRSLLAAGIKPTAVVLLEMSSLVYRDLMDLLFEGFDLSGICAFVSSTVDPRIPELFSSSIVFHRPLSSALSLFPTESSSCLPQAGPQAANAALEVLMMLGYRSLFLLGCDFGAKSLDSIRSKGAMGASSRTLDLPVRGSFGKTVYSSDELSTTRQAFENVLAKCDASAVAIGEGSKIQGVEYLTQSFKQASNTLSFETNASFVSRLASLPLKTKALSKDLNEVLNDAISLNALFVDASLKLLAVSSGIDRSLNDHFNSYLSWNDSGLREGDLLNRRISKYLIFIVYQSIRENFYQGVSWSKIQQKASESLVQIRELYDLYFRLFQFLNHAPYVPEWDPEWIRHRLKKLKKY